MANREAGRSVSREQAEALGAIRLMIRSAMLQRTTLLEGEHSIRFIEFRFATLARSSWKRPGTRILVRKQLYPVHP